MTELHTSSLSPSGVKPCLLVNGLLRSLQGSALDALEIEQVQTVQNTISTCLALVQCSLNRRQPIHRLHPELLGEILQLALPSTGGCLCEGVWNQAAALKAQRRAIMTFMQVCGRWRAIVLEMAAFWTIVDMSSGSAWSAACLERSKEAPLSVFLQYPLDAAQYLPLATRGHRIRDFFLDIPREHRAVFPTELPTILPAVPNLECLSIVTRCYIWDSDRPALDLERRQIIFPDPLPKLTRLVLKGPCWVPDGVPYHQLTHLHISQGMPLDLLSFLAFLGRCLSLEKLVLDDISIRSFENLSDDCIPTVELPALRLLTLGVDQSSQAASYVLENIHLSSPVTLRIIGVFAIDVLKDTRLHLPFTGTFDTLVIECTGEYMAVQAAGPHSGLLIHSVGTRYHWANVRETGEALRKALDRVLPCRNIKRVTIDSSACDATMRFLPDALSPVTLRLVDRCVQPGKGAQKERLHDMSTSGVSRFLDLGLTELEAWSMNDLLSPLPPIAPGSLRKYTFYHVRVAGSEESKLERHAMVEPPSHPGVDLRFVDNASWPKLDLPGVRPPCHLYDWK
ncbi:hypothetical protein GY45DRAFT_1374307 [Cubamyces sp. BRFM 1775]|nr:hypothetical protein GY45DRAFT_1374307 [Cubamyces sp. BRFM 1775]